MTYNYEKNIWGNNKATLSLSDPSNIRLRRLLHNLKSLPADAKILEVGCGAGSFIRAIKESHPDLDCYGTDLSQSAINQANKLNNNISFSVCGDNYFPYPNSHFDFIFFTDVLEHVNWPENFLVEIKRVLKDNGVLFLFIPCEKDVFSIWKYLNILGLKKDLTKKFAGHINYYSRKEVINLLDRVGFNVLDKTYAEHFFGQILGVTAFSLLNLRYKKTGEINNNEQYFSTKKNGLGNSLLNIIKISINSLISLESIVLSEIPSPNMFILAEKK